MGFEIILLKNPDKWTHTMDKLMNPGMDEAEQQFVL